MPGDREIRQGLSKAKGVAQEDRASAKEMWRGKLTKEEDSSAQGLRAWLLPRQLMGWAGCKARRVTGSAESNDNSSSTIDRLRAARKD